MLTAFYVDNGPHLPLWDHLPTLAFWFLPAAIGTPIILRAVIRARSGIPDRTAQLPNPEPECQASSETDV